MTTLTSRLLWRSILFRADLLAAMNDEEVVSTTLKAVAAALKLLLVPTIGGGHLGSTSKECCLPYREMNSTSVIVENIEISIGKDIDIPSQSHQFLQKSARLS
jgi:hypothetical protein